jgi:hypothetical protein
MPLLLDLYPSVRQIVPMVTVEIIPLPLTQSADIQELPQSSTTSGLGTLVQIGTVPLGISHDDIIPTLSTSVPDLIVQTFNIDVDTGLSTIEQKISTLIREIISTTRFVEVLTMADSTNVTTTTEFHDSKFTDSEAIDREP